MGDGRRAGRTGDADGAGGRAERAPNAPLLRARDVVKVYRRGQREVRALDGVSLELRPGEVLAIEGPSGAGKSTLLAILGALERPTSGTVVLAGAPLHRLGEGRLAAVRARQIGFVFQAFHLIPTLSARENVEAALVPLRLPAPERRRRAAALLARVGLEHRSDHLPAQLSGGEQQRVAIARALAADPPLILADEPTGNLDARTGEAVVRLLADLATAGKAVVMVSHAPIAREYATRRARLEAGRLHEE